MTAVLLPTETGHVHAWRIEEIEYSDCLAVRRYECACGAVDYDG